VESQASTVEELRSEGKYLVLTPAECVELVNRLNDADTFVLHPLLAGMPPALSWSSLERFEREVLPSVRRTPPGTVTT
jgi:hypothetical protein